MMLRCHWRTRQRRRLSSHHPKEHLRRSGRQPAVSGKCRHVGAVVPPLEPPVLHEMSKSPHQYCAWQCECEPEASGPSASRGGATQEQHHAIAISHFVSESGVLHSRALGVVARERHGAPQHLETNLRAWRRENTGSPRRSDSSHAIEQITLNLCIYSRPEYAIKMLYWNPC